jgi:hypothetical protein
MPESKGMPAGVYCRHVGSNVWVHSGDIAAHLHSTGSHHAVASVGTFASFILVVVCAAWHVYQMSVGRLRARLQ